MKAYLIDPDTLTVTEVEHDGDYKDILVHLKCDYLDVIRLDNGDCIYVDDEGLINGSQGGWFGLRNAPLGPFKGRGLVLGSDDEGASKEPYASLETIRDLIEFLAPMQVGNEVLFVPLDPTPAE